MERGDARLGAGRPHRRRRRRRGMLAARLLRPAGLLGHRCRRGAARRGAGADARLPGAPAVGARGEPSRAALLREARLAAERRDPGGAVPTTSARRRLLVRARGAVRRRRPIPALELLDATLPELSRGLTESAATAVAYQLFEKLGYGAVAITDTQRVLAFVGAGADHHHAGDQPIRPVYEAIARDAPLLAPLGIRTECVHAACPLGAAAVVPLSLRDGPVGAVVAYSTAG